MSEASLDDPLPLQFGKYLLLSRLPAGGMAEVFLALQRSALGVEKLVVLKRILPAKSQDPAYVAMFLREARIAATLSHPNIVQTFDAGELDGRHYIVMEHVHGEDLRTVLRAHRAAGGDGVPLEYALHVALALCEGLAYVHEKRDWEGAQLGIVHCDVSARNVVVSFAGAVKIVDFGIATTELEEISDSGSRELKRQVKGKARYMAPEQAAGEPLDARADIFSLGVILYELTTGRRCFPAAPASPQRGAQLPAPNSACVRPSEVVADYPPELEEIVMRALQEKRADRHESVRGMRAHLVEFMAREGIGVAPERTAAWMRQLFAEKLAEHEAFLRGIGGLVSRIDGESKSPAAEPPPRTQGSLAPQALNAQQTASAARSSRGGAVVAVASALTALGAMFYLRHDVSVRLTEVVRDRRAEQARPALPASVAPDPTGSLEVVSKPEGCTVSINGEDRAEMTPVKIDHLPLDRELHVKLAKAGFEPFRTVVKLAADAPFKDIDAQLRKVPATVVLKVDRRQSFNLWVDGTLWKDHARVEGLTPGEEHVLGFISPGYAPKSVRLTLEPGETRQVEVHLLRAPTAGRSDAEEQPTP